MKYELRIHDEKDNDSNILIPFNNFIGCLQIIFPDILSGKWKIFKNAYGYGKIVCEIDEFVWNKGSLTIKGEDLFPVLLTGDEYFNNVRMKKVDEDIEIGIFDSTFIYMRGDWERLEKVRPFFKKTDINEVDDQILY